MKGLLLILFGLFSIGICIRMVLNSKPTNKMSKIVVPVHVSNHNENDWNTGIPVKESDNSNGDAVSTSNPIPHGI